MSDQPFFKFPSTPYLIAPSNLIFRQDKILSNEEALRFFSERVSIEEKIDGANLGISFDTNGNVQIQNRGHIIQEPFTGQWSPLSNWLNCRISCLFDVLYERYILFGEWCFITHSVYYSSLPDWFISFDIFDKQSGLFLPVIKRNSMVEQMGLTVVPHIFSGHISRDMLDSYIGKSAYGADKCEGLYLRIDSSDRLLYRAKYVRNDFSQSIDTHWSKKAPKKNQLHYYSN